MITQKVVGSTSLGKAIEYTLGQWSKLIRYIDDGHLSIDNNRAERAIKPQVVGRKNSGYSRLLKMVLTRAQRFTASLKPRKPTALSSMTTWSSA